MVEQNLFTYESNLSSPFSNSHLILKVRRLFTPTWSVLLWPFQS